MKSLAKILSENTLYKDSVERDALMADPSRIATAFLFNFIGFLGLINRTDSPKVFAHVKKDKQLRLNSIGDDNNDLSLIVKLMFEGRFFINTSVPNEITKFLFLLKSGTITHVNDDIVHTWLDALTPKFAQSLDSKLRALYMEFRDPTDRKALGWIVDALKRQANKYETGGAGEFREIVKTISLNRAVAKPKVIPGVTPASSTPKVVASTPATSVPTPAAPAAPAPAPAAAAAPVAPAIDPEPSFPSIDEYKKFLIAPTESMDRQLKALYLSQSNWSRTNSLRNIAVSQVFADNLALLEIISNISVSGYITYDDWKIHSVMLDQATYRSAAASNAFFAMIVDVIENGPPSQFVRQLLAYISRAPNLIGKGHAAVVSYLESIQKDFKKECQHNRMGKNIFPNLVSFLRNTSANNPVKISPEKFAEIKTFFVEQSSKGPLIADGISAARELFGLLFEEPALDAALIKQTIDSFPTDADYVEFIRRPTNAEIARFNEIDKSIIKLINVYPKLDSEQEISERRLLLSSFASIYSNVSIKQGSEGIITIGRFYSSIFDVPLVRVRSFKRLWFEVIEADSSAGFTSAQKQMMMYMSNWGSLSTAASLVYKYIGEIQENPRREISWMAMMMADRDFESFVYKFYAFITGGSAKVVPVDVTEALNDELRKIAEPRSYIGNILDNIVCTTKFTREIVGQYTGRDIPYQSSAAGNNYEFKNVNLRKALKAGFANSDFDRASAISQIVEYIYTNKWVANRTGFYNTMQRLARVPSGALGSAYYNSKESRAFFEQFTADIIDGLIKMIQPNGVPQFSPGQDLARLAHEDERTSMRFMTAMFLSSINSFDIIGLTRASTATVDDYLVSIATKSPAFVKEFGYVINEINHVASYKVSRDPGLVQLLKYAPDAPNLREHLSQANSMLGVTKATDADRSEAALQLIERALAGQAKYTKLSASDFAYMIGNIDITSLTVDAKKRFLSLWKNAEFLAGLKLYKEENFKGSGSIANRNSYVTMITSLITDMVKTDPATVNEFFDHIDDRYVENKIGNNLIGKDHISDLIQKSVINPFAVLNESAMKQILAFNDIDYTQVIADMGIDVKRKRGEPLATYLLRIATEAEKMKKSGKGFKEPNVVQLPRDNNGLIADSKALTKYHTGGVHGSIFAKVTKTFDVHLDSKEFDEFLALAKAAGNDGTVEPAFHGTGGIAASMILRYGFKVSTLTSGSIAGITIAGKMLGPGIYFSNKLDKALQYVGNDGYGRKEGTKGYIFEMKPTLGPLDLSRKAAQGWESRGTVPGDGIKSPEWCVRDARKQLKILRAYEIVIVNQYDYDRFIKTSTLNEDTNTRMSFKSFVTEDETPQALSQTVEGGGGIQFVFYDDKIPLLQEDGSLKIVDYVEGVDFELPSHVSHEATAKGASITFASETCERVDIRFAGQMTNEERKRFERLMSQPGR